LAGELKENQKIQIILDAKPFDAKLDKTGVFSAAIPGQALETAKQKTLTAQLLENDVVKKSVELAYQVNTAANMAGVLGVDIQPINLASAEQNVDIKGKVIKPYSSLWLYFAIIVDNLALVLQARHLLHFYRA
jgi:hypothetical protein